MKSAKSIIQSAEKKVRCGWFSLQDYSIPKSSDYQHVIVFESDDWGSIRMPQQKGWDELLKKGYSVDKRPYERYDTLESSTDLEALFEVLRKHRDSRGNHPVITANMLVANPDFDRISQFRFSEYYYEPIAQTYTRYFGDSTVLESMRQGMEEGVFMPQSHGREHFNVTQWLKGLQSRDEDLLTAFQYGMCGIAPKQHPNTGNQLMNALRASSDGEQDNIEHIVDEGLQLFEQLWGFKSKTFVAPCYCWSESTERVLSEGGVQLIQTVRISKPAYRSPSRFFYSGQQNALGQLYSIRNCKFEPSTNEGGADISNLMTQVRRAFSQRKVAIFSTHRINYVGGIDENNRTHTLLLLDSFLTKLLKEYPNVVFLSSNKLIDLFKNENSHS